MPPIVTYLSVSFLHLRHVDVWRNLEPKLFDCLHYYVFRKKVTPYSPTQSVAYVECSSANKFV